MPTNVISIIKRNFNNKPKHQYIYIHIHGLATCKQPPRQTEKTKTEICKIFKDNGLKITIQANLKTVDFLDITINGPTNRRIQTIHETKQHTSLCTQTNQPPTKHHQKHTRKHQPKIISDLIKRKHIQPSNKTIPRRTQEKWIQPQAGIQPSTQTQAPTPQTTNQREKDTSHGTTHHTVTTSQQTSERNS